MRAMPFLSGLGLTALMVGGLYVNFVPEGERPDFSLDGGMAAEAGTGLQQDASGDAAGPLLVSADESFALDVLRSSPEAGGAAENDAQVDVRNVTPDGFTLPPSSDAPLRRVAPATRTSVAAAPPDDRIRFNRPVVLDAGHLRVVSDNQAVRLRIAGIDAPAFDAVCEDQNGGAWQCGARARYELARLIGTRSILCDTGEAEGGDTIEASCSVGRYDLAEWLVNQGWARPSEANGDDVVQAAHQQAVAGGKGVWGEAPQATLSAGQI